MNKVKAVYYTLLGVTAVVGMSLICLVSLEQWLRFGIYNRFVPIAIGWFLCLSIIGLSLVKWLRRVHKIRNQKTWRWRIVQEALVGEIQFLAKVVVARKKHK
jgi:hypothetical protein